MPAVSGRFYPSDPEDLAEAIDACFTHPLGPGSPGEPGDARSVRAVVAPHAGYMCSGMNAAHAYKALREDGLPEAYIVIGPDHYGYARGSEMCTEPYLTPFGPCRIHEGIAGRLRGVLPESRHPMEHSVEVHVPFIQSIDPDPAIVPIVMGDQSLRSAERLADALREACEGVDAVVVASTDMSHYVPKEVAEKQDGMVARRIAAGDVQGMYDTVRRHRITMCGYGPVAVAMMFSQAKDIQVLCRSDSYDSIGYDPDAVVGYLSAVMRA